MSFVGPSAIGKCWCLLSQQQEAKMVFEGDDLFFPFLLHSVRLTFELSLSKAERLYQLGKGSVIEINFHCWCKVLKVSPVACRPF